MWPANLNSQVLVNLEANLPTNESKFMMNNDLILLLNITFITNRLYVLLKNYESKPILIIELSRWHLKNVCLSREVVCIIQKLQK